MSGVSSELSSSTQLLTVTLYVKFLPFWQKKQSKINKLLGAFLRKNWPLSEREQNNLDKSSRENDPKENKFKVSLNTKDKL